MKTSHKNIPCLKNKFNFISEPMPVDPKEPGVERKL